MNIFRNISIKNKFLTIYIFVTIVLLSLIFREYYVLTKIKNLEKDIFDSFEFYNSVKKIQNHLSDYLLYNVQMSGVENLDDLKYFLEKNEFSNYDFKNEINEIKKFSKCWKGNNNPIKDSIVPYIKKINKTYKEEIIPSFSLLKLKKRRHFVKMFNCKNQLLDSTYNIKKNRFNFYEILEKHQKEVFEISILLEKNINKEKNRLDELIYLSEKVQKNSKIKIKKLLNTSNVEKIISILFIVITIAIVIFISSIIIKSLQKLQKYVSVLSKGNFQEELNIENNDEIGKIIFDINLLNNSLRKMSLFFTEIKKGNFNKKITSFSHKSEIGKALFEMRDSLLKINLDRKKIVIEEKKRNWANKGVSLIADVLRKREKNIEKLGDNIIAEIVRYLKANQGGLFLLNKVEKNNEYLEMISSFAYDKKKFINKKIKVGEGLLGASVLEKEIINITEIPEEYIEISSGLGEANPKNLLISPLNLENEILGVIEIASFSKFKDYEIEFIERIAENIASVISTQKINEQTSLFLKNAQNQKELLISQEEEMRQNLEELKATQEEMNRKEGEARGFINAIDNTLVYADFELNGKFIRASDKFLKIFNINITHDLEIFDFIKDDFQLKFEKLWDNLIKNGENFEKKLFLKTHNNKEILIWLYLAPVYDIRNRINKILFIAFDVFEKNQIYETIINKNFANCEVNKDGSFVKINNKFSEIFGFSDNEIKSLNIFDFVQMEDKNEIKNIFENLKNKKIFSKKIILKTKTEFIKTKIHFNYIENISIKEKIYITFEICKY
ncbi:MAG: hypothetical protein B6I24_09060 [Bacteroidetes bacterium 4572_128]|nr:MAG: hypothetical protein B6I24_09060 [Bacteroidetes bacterium 4572_128]